MRGGLLEMQSGSWEIQMLRTISATLIMLWLMLWLLGIGSGDAVDYFIHVPFFMAIIAMLIQIKADCRDYGDDQRRKRYFKRQLVADRQRTSINDRPCK